MIYKQGEFANCLDFLGWLNHFLLPAANANQVNRKPSHQLHTQAAASQGTSYTVVAPGTKREDTEIFAITWVGNLQFHSLSIIRQEPKTNFFIKHSKQ